MVRYCAVSFFLFALVAASPLPLQSFKDGFLAAAVINQSGGGIISPGSGTNVTDGYEWGDVRSLCLQRSPTFPLTSVGADQVYDNAFLAPVPWRKNDTAPPRLLFHLTRSMKIDGCDVTRNIAQVFQWKADQLEKQCNIPTFLLSLTTGKRRRFCTMSSKMVRCSRCWRWDQLTLRRETMSCVGFRNEKTNRAREHLFSACFRQTVP